MKQRRLWTHEEDKVLKFLREEEKIKKWSVIAKVMEYDYTMSNRTGKQCRQRYFNHLDSQIKRQEWSHEQENLLWQMHSEYGNRWTLMANKIKGRSQNCIKNHFYSKVRKAVRKLNKLIIQRFKTQYRQIKISLLYKLLESAEDKFRPGISSDIEMMDRATGIKNRLFLYENQTLENPKQHQITRDLIVDINKLEEKLKQQFKYQKNNSGFLDPRSLKKINSSFQSQDSLSVYSSTSYNSSFQASEDEQSSIGSPKPLIKTSSLRVKHSLERDGTIEKQSDKLLGAQLVLKSLQLRPSRSEKTFTFQICVEDQVSDIGQTKIEQPGHFQKCISDIVKNQKSENEFDFRDEDFLNVKSQKYDEGCNFFDEPGFSQFQLRVFSPIVPGDEGNKMQEQSF